MALDDVMWTFSKKIYESTEEFNKDIKAYYDQMREYVNREWNPDEVAVNQMKQLMKKNYQKNMQKMVIFKLM